MNKFEIEYEFEIRRYKGDYYDPTEYVDTLEYTYKIDEETLKEWLEERDIEYSDLEEAFEDNYEALKKHYRNLAKEAAKFWL